jgi:hypothetical protein
VDEETRRSFGIKYGRFVISNDVQEKEAAREFLQNAGGLEYIPEDLKAAEIILVGTTVEDEKEIFTFKGMPKTEMPDTPGHLAEAPTPK